MESAAVNALLCPHCGESFNVPSNTATSLVCPQGHSFDIAKQGYLNLLTGHGTKFASDSAAMVEARDAFLTGGHYQPLANALAELVQQLLPASNVASAPPLIVDAGTGTGWYLHQILSGVNGDKQSHVSAVGMDISKFALRRAARRNPLAANIVWDLWRDLPLGASTADVVLVVFAPRNASEFARILKPGGTLVVVTPLPHHLAEVAAEAGMLGIQKDKESALVDSLAEHFALADSRELELALELSPSDVGQVALMGPAGHHLDPVELGERLAHLVPVTKTTAAFRISTFRLLRQHDALHHILTRHVEPR